jgi:FkbM family methyltransferase
MDIFQPNKKHIKDIKFPAFIIKNGNATADWIMDSGIPEINLIEYCKKFLDSDSCLVDIGAHMGTYSIMLARHCKKVYAYEAQRITYYQLCGNIALNKRYNVHAYNYGICDEGDFLRALFVTSEDGGGSTFIPQNKSIQTEYVEMKMLDSFSFEKIGLIKIDIEGYELKALKGAIKTLDKHNYPPILFESNNDDKERKELIEFLNNLGYSVERTQLQYNMFLAIKNV